MKKSISVNISGMLFNIEEDAYERLKHYLEEVKRYFMSYQASEEIVADIENRIAEIFGTKVGPHKQVLTSADVESLITQMGNVQDFAAIEEPYEEAKATNSHSYETYSGTSSESSYQSDYGKHTNTHKRLYRDVNQKILGGVAAGLARYLGIDPMWLRLILLAFVAFDVFITFAISSSALIIGYIVLWVALPARSDLAEDKKVKKMFRNPDDKVVAGVAGGLGAYFGLDPVMIRIIFALAFILGGSGLLIYIILWICMPMARTLTDRMQMQGEPVTLANIEEQVKKSLNVKEGEEESPAARILLFPFRLLSTIFSGSGAAAQTFLHFLGNALRMVIGLGLTLGSIFVLMGMLVSAAVVAGAYHQSHLQFFDIEAPIALLRNTVPDYLLLAVLLVSAIPVLFVMLFGLSLISRRWVMPKTGSWALAGVWVIAFITTAAMIPALIFNYQENDYYESESAFERDASQTLVLKTQNGNWRNLRNVDLTIKGSPDSLIRLKQRIWGRGATPEEALEHARMAQYPVEKKGNTLFFGNQLELPKDKPYYAQHAKATLYIPYGQPFSMAYEMKKILYNTLSPWGYRTRDLENNTFAFNRQGELECLTCSEERRGEAQNSKAFTSSANGRLLNHKDFDNLKVGSHYQFTVIQGEDFKVEVTGSDQVLDDMEVKQNGSTLSFSEEGWSSGWWKKNKNKRQAHIYITVPNLAGLYLSGASRGNVKLKQAQNLKVALSGAAELQGALETESLAVDMSGSSEMRLEGSSENLFAELSGASTLKAADFHAKKAKVSLSGASEALVWVTERLTGEASGGSRLGYKGDPAETDLDHSGGASINQQAD